MAETTETIEEKIKKQQDLVKNLEESCAENPSDDAKQQFYRERDTLRHMTHSLFGAPKQRAANITVYARETALGRVIQSTPDESEN